MKTQDITLKSTNDNGRNGAWISIRVIPDLGTFCSILSEYTMPTQTWTNVYKVLDNEIMDVIYATLDARTCLKPPFHHYTAFNADEQTGDEHKYATQIERMWLNSCLITSPYQMDVWAFVERKRRAFNTNSSLLTER